MTHLADFAAGLEQKLKEVEADNVFLANQRDELLDALEPLVRLLEYRASGEDAPLAQHYLTAARAVIAKVRS